MKQDYIVGSGNVFTDLDFENPEDELAKVKLVSIINDIIEQRGLTPNQAEVILGVNQPKLSDLHNGRLKIFSIEQLFSFLEKLDQHIEITIFDKSKAKTVENISVAYV